MEVSSFRYSGGVGLHARTPLLRLQSDERLITLVRRGNATAFEVLVARYQSRLLSFCRHLLGSKEDAEDVLQEVMAAAYNAMIADERPINVRPWLYRIARNRCLNHLRRAQAVGVDSMDIHFSDHGASTADKVHMAEEFRMLVGDIQSLPETQRTALVLREMDALSYEQIAEAMETTVPSVKSLLVRARLSLAEAAEARLLSCSEVRIELAEVAEGLLAKPSAPVRRHLRTCQRCGAFQSELKRTTKALAALLPLGPVALLKQLVFAHLGQSAGTGAGASAGGAAGTGAAIGSGAAAGGALVGAGAGTAIPFGIGALATKAAAGLAAAALFTAGAVEVTHSARPSHPHPLASASSAAATPAPSSSAPASTAIVVRPLIHHDIVPVATHHARDHAAGHPAVLHKSTKPKTVAVKLTVTPKPVSAALSTKKSKTTKPATAPGTTDSQSVTTVLEPTSAAPTSTTSSTAAPTTTTTTSTPTMTTQPTSSTPGDAGTGTGQGTTGPAGDGGSTGDSTGTGTGSSTGTGPGSTGGSDGTGGPGSTGGPNGSGGSDGSGGPDGSGGSGGSVSGPSPTP